MEINKLQLTLYADSKSNTITAYVKFNRMADQIYLGFRDTAGNSTYHKSLTCKSKQTKTHVSGVRAILHTPTSNYHNWEFELILENTGETFIVELEPTGDYPIVTTGIWEKSIDFNTWLNTGDTASLQKSKLHSMLENANN
jgi:hypothetical protein